MKNITMQIFMALPVYETLNTIAMDHNFFSDLCIAITSTMISGAWLKYIGNSKK